MTARLVAKAYRLVVLYSTYRNRHGFGVRMAEVYGACCRWATAATSICSAILQAASHLLTAHKTGMMHCSRVSGVKGWFFQNLTHPV